MNQYPHTVEIQHYTKVSDGGGGYVQQWVKLMDKECEVSAVNGSEYYQAQQITNPINFNVNMDYDAAIKPDMRVVFGGVTMKIVSALPILPDINGEWEKLTLKCVSL